MSVHAFVDETKDSGLLVVAALLAPRDLRSARSTMRRMLLPGQARLHFTKERPSRRAQIADAVCATGVRIDVYDARGVRDPKQARALCLERIVADLAASGATRLVIEQDDSLVKHDQRVLHAAVRAAEVVDVLSYEHLPARSEPLLWLPDAAAWCWAHGSTWRQRLSTVLGDVHVL